MVGARAYSVRPWARAQFGVRTRVPKQVDVWAPGIWPLHQLSARAWTWAALSAAPFVLSMTARGRAGAAVVSHDGERKLLCVRTGQDAHDLSS